MPDTPPWLEYQQAPASIPLSGPDPDLAAQRAQRALSMRLAVESAQRQAAAEARAQADFASKNTMVPPPGDTAKTGDEYLRTLPPSLAGQVKALSEGRRAFPTGAALRSPAIQELIAAATQYDPTLDAANAATRVATRKNFTSGKARQNMTAINTALGHLGTLWDRAQNLKNRSVPVWNAIANRYETETGDKRVKEFNFAKQAVVDEITRVFKGTGGNLTEVLEWQKQLSPNSSPEQLRGVVGTAVELLHSRLEALSQEYSGGMGRSADPIEFLTPHSQKVFEALGPDGDGNVPPPPKGGDGVPPILGGGSPPPSVPPDGPTLGLATGKTRSVLNPQQTAKLDSAIRSGLPYRTAMALFPGIPPADKTTYEAAVQFAKNNPGYNKSLAEVTRSVPTTAFQRFAASPLAAGIVGAGNAATAGTVDEMAAGINHLVGGDQSLAEINAKKQLLAAEHPVADIAGNVVGGTAAMLGGGAALRGLGLINKARMAANPILANLAGDAAYGAAYGAGENNDSRLAGAGVGALAGAGGSLVGTAATKALGAGIRGVVNPAAERLRARGIPLTVGEVLGGGWKKAQDAMTSIPGPGTMVARRALEGREAFNRAAFNEAGEPIGAQINAVGQPAIDALETAKSGAYSNALDPVNVGLIPGGVPEPGFANDIAAIQAEIAKIPDPEARQAALDAVTSRIKNNLAPSGDMSGRGFQEAYRGLARVPKERGQKPYAYEVAKVTRSAQDALASVLERQNPEAYAAFLKANKANRGLSILTDAVNAAKNQVDDGNPLFTPAQLSTAATNNTKTFGGKVAAASGQRPFNQLALDAQQVMGQRVPDSGTTARAIVGLGLTSLGGAGTGYGADGDSGAVEGGLAPAALLTLLGTKRGQALLTNALIKRTALMQRGGRAVARNPQFGADIFAAAGIPLLAGE